LSAVEFIIHFSRNKQVRENSCFECFILGELPAICKCASNVEKAGKKRKFNRTELAIGWTWRKEIGCFLLLKSVHMWASQGAKMRPQIWSLRQNPSSSIYILKIKIEIKIIVQ
jgi:hypothetical protein